MDLAGEWKEPGLLTELKAQAEAGPLMLMVRRANMSLP
jgi:hypothetical protein